MFGVLFGVRRRSHARAGGGGGSQEADERDDMLPRPLRQDETDERRRWPTAQEAQRYDGLSNLKGSDAGPKSSPKGGRGSSRAANRPGAVRAVSERSRKLGIAKEMRPKESRRRTDKDNEQKHTRKVVPLPKKKVKDIFNRIVGPPAPPAGFEKQKGSMTDERSLLMTDTRCEKCGL
ncbi:hypothetical protein E4U21_002791, partial [Claviceps maximensis]